jgi:ribosome-binding factor A
MSELRNQRLTTVIHRAVQGVIAKGLADPRLDECMVTITSVKLSADQRSAILGVSITPEKRERLALSALESASRHIRRRAADLVSVHKMPDLVFKLDRSFKRQAEVLSALNLVREELGVEPGAPLPPATEPAAGDESGPDSASTDAETDSESPRRDHEEDAR